MGIGDQDRLRVGSITEREVLAKESVRIKANLADSQLREIFKGILRAYLVDQREKARFLFILATGEELIESGLISEAFDITYGGIGYGQGLSSHQASLANRKSESGAVGEGDGGDDPFQPNKTKITWSPKDEGVRLVKLNNGPDLPTSAYDKTTTLVTIDNAVEIVLAALTNFGPKQKPPAISANLRTKLQGDKKWETILTNQYAITQGRIVAAQRLR